MPITPLSGSGGFDEVWGDDSGGSLLAGYQHPNYTSVHIFRVIPFDTIGTGIFNSPPAGTTANIQQEADNLAALIAAIYAADTQIAFFAVLQALADHTGEVPYNFTFAGSSTVVGTAGGTSFSVPTVLELVSRGTDGSRWRSTFPGYSSAISNAQAHKELASSSTGAALALYKYLTGQTNGGVHAVKTNVVTHNGASILGSPATYIQAMNKRLRRHFGDV